MINLINATKATITGLAAGALLSSVLLIPTPEVKAGELYRDTYGNGTGGASYNNGRYEENTLQGGGLYGGGVIEDRKTGRTYNCDSIGNCHSWY